MADIVSNKLIELLNYRIEQETISSFLYKSMSLWLDVNGFKGASKKWKEYEQEELKHADWAYNYLLDLNIVPKTPNVPSQPMTYKGLAQIVALSFEHELKITEQCKEFSKESFQEGDFMTFTIAQKFIQEQIEELSKTQLWLDRLEAFGVDKTALRLLDNEMGQ